MDRYSAAKHRRENKDSAEASQNSNSAEANDCSDKDKAIVYPSNTTCTHAQTDLTVNNLTALEDDYQQRMIEASQHQCIKGYPIEDDLKSNDELLRFYTGLHSFNVLMSVYTFVATSLTETPVSKLSKFQCFILTLMKLRLNSSNYDLAFRFGISESTVGRIFARWIEAMDIRLSFLIAWPDQADLHKTMPFCYRINYGLNITSIIDCFELFIEKPSNLLAKACTWSQYKHYNTAKYLISITPQGTVSFISNGWGGRVSDKHIVENSGYLRHIIPGDVILADRGFDVADTIALRQATLNIPAFTRGCDQLPAKDVEDTRKLANVRIHVERVIGSIRQRFQILSATGVLPKEYVSKKSYNGRVMLDSIVTVCCALNNVCAGIVPFN